MFQNVLANSGFRVHLVWPLCFPDRETEARELYKSIQRRRRERKMSKHRLQMSVPRVPPCGHHMAGSLQGGGRVRLSWAGGDLNAAGFQGLFLQQALPAYSPQAGYVLGAGDTEKSESGSPGGPSPLSSHSTGPAGVRSGCRGMF